MNAVQRSRAHRRRFVICDDEARYLRKAWYGWDWTTEKTQAKVFHFYGAAVRRAALVQGTAIELTGDDDARTG